MFTRVFSFMQDHSNSAVHVKKSAYTNVHKHVSLKFVCIYANCIAHQQLHYIRCLLHEEIEDEYLFSIFSYAEFQRQPTNVMTNDPK